MGTGIGLQDVIDLQEPKAPQEPAPPSPDSLNQTTDLANRILGTDQAPSALDAWSGSDGMPDVVTIGRPTIHRAAPLLGQTRAAQGSALQDPLGLGQLEAQQPLRNVVPQAAPTINFAPIPKSEPLQLGALPGQQEQRLGLAGTIAITHPELNGDQQRIKDVVDWLRAQPDPEAALRSIVTPAFDPFTRGADFVNKYITDPLAEATNKTPIFGLPGGGLGGLGGYHGRTAEDNPVTKFAYGSLPYVAADVATGNALMPAYLANAGLQVTAISDRYAAGEISGKQALEQGAMNVGPFVLGPLLHGLGAGAEALAGFHDSPAGQAFVRKLQEIHADESGHLGTGEEPPRELPTGEPPQRRRAPYDTSVPSKSAAEAWDILQRHPNIGVMQSIPNAVGKVSGYDRLIQDVGNRLTEGARMRNVTVDELLTAFEDGRLHPEAVPYLRNGREAGTGLLQSPAAGSPRRQALEADRLAAQSGGGVVREDRAPFPGEDPEQARFTPEGEVTSERLLQGDRGQQGDLLGAPAQTGEGLALEGAGPMFAGETAKLPSLGDLTGLTPDERQVFESLTKTPQHIADIQPDMPIARKTMAISMLEEYGLAEAGSRARGGSAMEYKLAEVGAPGGRGQPDRTLQVTEGAHAEHTAPAHEVGSGYLPADTNDPYFEQPPPDWHTLPERPSQALELRRQQIEQELAANPMTPHTGAVRRVQRFTKRIDAAYGGTKAKGRLVDQIAVDDSTYSKLKANKEARGLPFNAEEAKDANRNHTGWWVEYEDELHGLDAQMETDHSPSIDQLHRAIELKAELKDVTSEIRAGNPDEQMTSTDAAHMLRDNYHLLYHDVLNNAADEETAQMFGDVAQAYEDTMAAVRAGDHNMPLTARQVLGLPERAKLDLNAAATAEPVRPRSASPATEYAPNEAANGAAPQAAHPAGEAASTGPAADAATTAELPPGARTPAEQPRPAVASSVTPEVQALIDANNRKLGALNALVGKSGWDQAKLEQRILDLHEENDTLQRGETPATAETPPPSEPPLKLPAGKELIAYRDRQRLAREVGSVGREMLDERRAAGATPPPPKPPRPADKQASAPPPPPPKSVGNVFAAPLRPLLDVAGEVKSREDVIGKIIARSGINPSLEADEVGKTITAYERQRASGEELTKVALQAAVDTHAEAFTGRNATFHIGEGGEVGNIGPTPAGTSRVWQDVFSRPGDYRLSADQRAYIADYRQVIDDVERLRTDAGLTPRAKQGEEGWFYIPRKTKEAHGIDLRRPANPGLQRIYETAQEGIDAGIRYDTNPRATLDLHVRAAYREIADKQLSDALEPLSLTPRDLVPAALRAQAEKAGRNLASAQEAILALQRARRGEQIPTSTIEMIERVFPKLEGEVQDATQLTLQDLYKVSANARERGELVFKPVTPGTLKAYVKNIAQLEENARLLPNNKRVQEQLRKARQQQGFARYRFGMEEDFRTKSGMSLGDMLEDQASWTRIQRSTRTLMRESPRNVALPSGEVVERTQKELLQGIISDIRGVPYNALTETGNQVTRYRGGLLEPLRQEVQTIRQRYTQAIARARNTEVIAADREIRRALPGNVKERQAAIRLKGIPPATTAGEFFGADQGEHIAISTWRNRFYRREDADLLRERLEKQGAGGPWDRIGRGFEIAGNYSRYFATGGDVAAPFTHGLPVFGRNPVIWARGAWSHYVAMFDPKVQANLMRRKLGTFQEMARYGLPVGDTEFFQALQSGEGISPGKLIEPLPGGARVRETAQQIGKQTYGRSSTSYTNFLSLARSELWESMTHLAPADRAETIRNLTGGLDSAGLGVGRRQRQFESFWVGFAPKLFRSTAALVASLRNPISPTGQEAWRSLAGMAAGVAAVYVAAGYGMGRSREEIEHGLNPLAGKKFLSYNVNGDYIGIGGQVRSLTQMTTRIAVDPKSVLEPDMRDNPLLSFYSTRGAPGYEQFKNVKDNADSPPDLAKHLGTASLPFVGQAYLDGQGWGGVAAQEAGLRTSHETPFETLTFARDKAAQRAGYEDYADAQQKLGGPAAAAKFAADQNVAAAQATLDEQPSKFADALQATVPDQQQNDADFESGAKTAQQWRDQNKIINASRARGIADYFAGAASKPTGDDVLDGYYAVFRKYTNPKSGIVNDEDGLNTALDDYQAKLTPEQQARLDANTGTRSDSPVLAAYHADVKKLAASGYFGLSDRGFSSDIWQKKFAAAGLTAAKNYSSLADFKNAYINARSNAQDPVSVHNADNAFERLAPVRQFRKGLTQARLDWFKADPTLLAVATKWGFNTLSKAEAKILQGAGLTP